MKPKISAHYQPSPAFQNQPVYQRPVFQRTLTTITLISCIVSGCATPQQNSALECGAGGAVGGYLACKLMGNSDEHCAKIAAGVGAIGAAACYTYASNLEKRRKELEGKENDLDSRLQYVRGVNKDSQDLNDQLRKQVDATVTQTNQTIEDYNNQQLSAEELDAQRRNLDAEIGKANQQLAASKTALDDMEQFQARQTQRSAELDAEIARQKQLFAESQQLVTNLSSQRQKIG